MCSVMKYLIVLMMAVDMVYGQVTELDCGINEKLENGSCLQCPVCPIGLGLSQPCGFGEGAFIDCTPCPEGTYNSNPQGDICFPCLDCGIYKREFKYKCRPTINAECGACLFGYFDSYSDRIDSDELYFCSGCGLNPDSQECLEWKKTQIDRSFTTQDGEIITDYPTISVVVIEQNKFMATEEGFPLSYALGLGTTLVVVTIAAAIIIGCLIFRNSILRHTCSKMKSKFNRGNDDDSDGPEKRNQVNQDYQDFSDDNESTVHQNHYTERTLPGCSKFGPEELIPPAVFYKKNVDSVHVRCHQSRASTSSEASDSTLTGDAVFQNATAPPLLIPVNPHLASPVKSQHSVKEEATCNPTDDNYHMYEPLLSRVSSTDSSNPYFGEASLSPNNLELGSEAPTLCIRDYDYIPEEQSLLNCVNRRSLSVPSTQIIHRSMENQGNDQSEEQLEAYRNEVPLIGDTVNSATVRENTTVPKTTESSHSVSASVDIPAKLKANEHSKLSSCTTSLDVDANKNLVTYSLPSTLERGTSTTDLKDRPSAQEAANPGMVPSMVFHGPATIRIGHQQIGQHHKMIHFESISHNKTREEEARIPKEEEEDVELSSQNERRNDSSRNKMEGEETEDTSSEKNSALSEVELLQQEKLNKCSSPTGSAVSDQSLRTPIQASQSGFSQPPTTTCGMAQANVTATVYAGHSKENMALRCEV